MSTFFVSLDSSSSLSLSSPSSIQEEYKTFLKENKPAGALTLQKRFPCIRMAIHLNTADEFLYSSHCRLVWDDGVAMVYTGKLVFHTHEKNAIDIDIHNHIHNEWEYTCRRLIHCIRTYGLDATLRSHIKSGSFSFCMYDHPNVYMAVGGQDTLFEWTKQTSTCFCTRSYVVEDSTHLNAMNLNSSSWWQWSALAQKWMIVWDKRSFVTGEPEGGDSESLASPRSASLVEVERQPLASPRSASLVEVERQPLASPRSASLVEVERQPLAKTTSTLSSLYRRCYPSSTFSFSSSLSAASYSSLALRGFYNLFRESVVDLLPLQIEQPVVCFLSGGLFSQILAAVLQDVLKKRGSPRLQTIFVGTSRSCHLPYVMRFVDYFQTVHTNVLLPFQKTTTTTETDSVLEHWLGTDDKECIRQGRILKECCELASWNMSPIVFCGEGGNILFPHYKTYLSPPNRKRRNGFQNNHITHNTSSNNTIHHGDDYGMFYDTEDDVFCYDTDEEDKENIITPNEEYPFVMVDSVTDFHVSENENDENDENDEQEEEDREMTALFQQRYFLWNSILSQYGCQIRMPYMSATFVDPLRVARLSSIGRSMIKEMAMECMGMPPEYIMPHHIGLFL